MDGVADGTSEGHVDGLLLGSRVGSSECVVVLGAEEGAADGDKDILGTIEGDKEGFWLGNADGEEQLRNSRSALMVFPYTSKLLFNIVISVVSLFPTMVKDPSQLTPFFAMKDILLSTSVPLKEPKAE